MTGVFTVKTQETKITAANWQNKTAIDGSVTAQQYSDVLFIVMRG